MGKSVRSDRAYGTPYGKGSSTALFCFLFCFFYRQALSIHSEWCHITLLLLNLTTYVPIVICTIYPASSVRIALSITWLYLNVYFLGVAGVREGGLLKQDTFV